MEKNKPARVLRDGYLKATIWANPSENGVYYSTAFAKTFTDRQGKVRDTNSFSGADILRIAELARRAYQASGELRAEYKRNFNPRAASSVGQAVGGQAGNGQEQTNPHQAPMPGSS